MSLTANNNFLSPLGFTFRVEHPSFANVNFTAVSTSLPGINLNEVLAGFRAEQGYVPGDKIIYDPVTIKMIVNEDMDNYLEIWNWLANNQSAEQALRCDVNLTILTSHKNPNIVVKYHDAFPTSITGIEFNTQLQDVDYASVDVTFRFNRVSFDRV